MAYGGGLGVEAENDEKPFLGWMGYFRERARKWNRKGETARERERERGVLHDFKLTIIVGCDMYYVSRGSESWAHFHGEEGNKSPLSQFERVQLAWAPHLTANYNSSSSKSLPQLSKANHTMHSLLLASLDVQLTECSLHFLSPPSPAAVENKTVTSETLLSCSTLYQCTDKIIAVGVLCYYYICARRSITLLSFSCYHKWEFISTVSVLPVYIYS